MRFRRQRGDVFAETAFALPVVLLVTLGLLQGGLLAYAASAASQAARHGARMASVAQGGLGAAVAVSEAYQTARQLFPMDSPAVELLAPGGAPGSEITVRVTLRVPNLLSPLSALFPVLPRGAFPVQASATFRQEGW
ncbi:TadE/TadG family type IV pilus assembly protein [Thermoflexus sp.]|uniref:TadE/TadG family type IV pilus assembly protein n=1 Tax=Thermoflexus sp. TaxID=1969742 RepID=UPI002ADE683B|nr:TadE/TadG family type IV pilus assembly protein [Thermoflexus sp.]